MFRILCRLIAALAHLAARSGRSKDLEIVVLSPQLAVLRRQIDRPGINHDDRTLLDAIAAALPRPRRSGWLVTPDILLDGTANASPWQCCVEGPTRYFLVATIFNELAETI